MHGNVAEWVLDAYTPEGYPQTTGGSAKDPLLVPRAIYPRVVRGGSWLDDPNALRSARRTGSSNDWNKQDPQIPQSIWYHTDASHVGFRVVRPLRTPTAEQAAQYDLDDVQKTTLADYIELKGNAQ